MTAPEGRSVRNLLPAVAVSVAVCGALLVMQYTLAMPTEDVRARVYHLLRSMPPVFVPFFVVMLTGASVAALWVVGDLSVAGLLVAGGVAAAGTMVLYAGVLDGLVWRTSEEVTTAGQFVRMAAASLGAATVMLWVRRRV